MKLRVCRRCGTAVKKSTVYGYRYYCPNHEEYLFEFETYLIDIPGVKRHNKTKTHKENNNHEYTLEHRNETR